MEPPTQKAPFWRSPMMIAPQLQGWLRTLATTFISCSDCTLGGRTINELPHNPYSTASQLITDYLYAHWNADSTRATFFASYNLALPQKMLSYGRGI